jgi:hypothetical protein
VEVGLLEEQEERHRLKSCYSALVEERPSMVQEEELASLVPEQAAVVVCVSSYRQLEKQEAEEQEELLSPAAARRLWKQAKEELQVEEGDVKLVSRELQGEQAQVAEELEKVVLELEELTFQVAVVEQEETGESQALLVEEDVWARAELEVVERKSQRLAVEEVFLEHLVLEAPVKVVRRSVLQIAASISVSIETDRWGARLSIHLRLTSSRSASRQQRDLQAEAHCS